MAAEVGINRASLYYYVGTKEELLLALIEEPARDMTRHCRAALESDEPADVKLRVALHCYVDDLQNHPELFLLFSESQHIAAIPPMPTASAATPRIMPRPYSRSSRRASAQAFFRADLEPRLVTHGILGMHNWIHRWYVPSGRRSLTEIGEVFAR